MKSILVVDDERQITRMLRASLQASGYSVIVANDGIEAYEGFKSKSPDLVITDLAMPEMNGLELTQAIRRESLTPIIVLSVRDSDIMKIQALDQGADDYLTKPFSMPELLARVRAQLRRSSQINVQQSAPIAVGDFTWDLAAHTATLCGQDLHLTPKEFQLLGLLLRNAERVVTRRILLRTIWGPSAEDQPEYLRVLIGQLRKKVDGGERQYIQSEPWVGYRLQPAGIARE